MEAAHDLDQVYLTLSALGTFTLANANDFLSNTSVKKDGRDRLFSWLVKLNVVKTVTASSLLQLYNDYQAMIQNYFHDIDNPLADLEESQRQIMTADVTRSIMWFETISSDIGLSRDDIAGTERHIYRILASLVKTDRIYEYTQGYDRFVHVAYSLGLLFAVSFGIQADFGEALAFYLSKKMIELVRVWDVLENIQIKQKEFEKLDKVVRNVAPDVAENLCEHGSFHYALKWRLLMFADEHKITDLLLIWDAIFLKKDKFDEYMTDMILAHVRQVKPDPDFIMIERIQKFRNWDAEEILAYANKRCTVRSIKKNAEVMLKILGVVAAIAGAYYMRKYMQKIKL